MNDITSRDQAARLQAGSSSIQRDMRLPVVNCSVRNLYGTRSVWKDDSVKSTDHGRLAIVPSAFTFSLPFLKPGLHLGSRSFGIDIDRSNDAHYCSMLARKGKSKTLANHDPC